MESNEYSSSRFERIYDEENNLQKSVSTLEISNITLDVSIPPIPKLNIHIFITDAQNATISH